MAIKNQKTLTSSNGTPIPTNNVIAFKTIFEPRTNKMHVDLFIWYSESKYIDLSVSCLADKCKEIVKYSWDKTLTQQDFNYLTPEAVHAYVIQEIESWDSSWQGKLTII